MDRERLTIWLTLTCCVLRILVAMHDRCFDGEVGIHDNERHVYSLGGSTKTKAKTCHSGTVNYWAAIIFAPFSSTDCSTVTEVCTSVRITRIAQSCASLVIPSRIYSSLVSSKVSSYLLMHSLHECYNN